MRQQRPVRTTPQGPSRKPMIVVERIAMTSSTMPEEAKMAVFRGMNSWAKYVNG
jgi:hypothetical protein